LSKISPQLIFLSSRQQLFASSISALLTLASNSFCIVEFESSIAGYEAHLPEKNNKLIELSGMQSSRIYYDNLTGVSCVI
jgi:hypothetical protein